MPTSKPPTEPPAPPSAVDRAADGFASAFGGRPLIVASAPGRVNLIGEHTDYNAGFVLPMALELRTSVAVRPRGRTGDSTPTAELYFADLPEPGARRATVTGTPTHTRHASKPAWYVSAVLTEYLGVAAEAGRLGDVPSFDAYITSDVPVGAGLSSSAALEVATMTALEALSGFAPHPKTKALRCQAAEHAVGVPCGIMDQFISAMGVAGHALLIDCRSFEAEPVPLADEGVALLVINTNVHHELTDGGYAARRKACEDAVELLQQRDPDVRALRDVSPEMLQRHRHALSDLLHRRARHVVTENPRVLAFAEAVRAGDNAAAGRLMLESHASLRDDYQVSCVELDAAVEAASEAPGCFGARMTGGGFGGCAVALVRSDAAAQIAQHVAERVRARGLTPPTCFVTRAGGGAGFTRTA